MKTASALIPAAGSGVRFGSGANKVFYEIAGRPILAHTLSVFEDCDAIDEIIVVTGSDDIEAAGEIVGRFGFTKVLDIVPGGVQRQDSVANGLAKITGDVVAIHDAARPMVTTEIISRSIEEARCSGACIAAVPVIDTIKSVADSTVLSTIDRSNLYSVQTPQTFQSKIIREAYAQALADGVYATDDAALVERIGKQVSIVPGSYENIKITTPADVSVAAARLSVVSGTPCPKTSGTVSVVSGTPCPETRTGVGFDVHRLVEGRRLILGGVEIDFPLGLHGHSDADVLLHSIADACLGAASLGDIGRHFPDTDPQYKGASSLNLLARVGELLRVGGWQVANIDAVVICERPKIAPFASQMADLIAEALSTDSSRVSIKGTTTEGLGYTGRGEGIACQAVATLRHL